MRSWELKGSQNSDSVSTQHFKFIVFILSNIPYQIALYLNYILKLTIS